ncbi:MAG: hypothetical protein K2H82_07745 [Oscillospiraceae bacterium]|nr:hypothetical protein [Oscillospiraceae bacterium]
MKSELIQLLESFGFPVFLQGSLNSTEDYPDSFFTFWNFENPEQSFYDNNANRCIWGFWIYFYSVNPVKVEKFPEQARQLLKSSGWTVGGKPTDIKVDKITHTGAFFKAYYIETYKKESGKNA